LKRLSIYFNHSTPSHRDINKEQDINDAFSGIEEGSVTKAQLKLSSLNGIYITKNADQEYNTQITISGKNYAQKETFSSLRQIKGALLTFYKEKYAYKYKYSFTLETEDRNQTNNEPKAKPQEEKKETKQTFEEKSKNTSNHRTDKQKKTAEDPRDIFKNFSDLFGNNEFNTHRTRRSRASRTSAPVIDWKIIAGIVSIFITSITAFKSCDSSNSTYQRVEPNIQVSKYVTVISSKQLGADGNGSARAVKYSVIHMGDTLIQTGLSFSPKAQDFKPGDLIKVKLFIDGYSNKVRSPSYLILDE